MRAYSHLYNAARQSGAKPYIVIELWADNTCFLLTKETPPAELFIEQYAVYIGSDVVTLDSNPVYFEVESGAQFQVEPRVLNFGDFSQALSTDSQSIGVSLAEKLMDSYSPTLDNADGFFTEFCARYQMLGAKLILKQGWEWPGIRYNDFITLFTGKVTNYELTTTRCQLVADQAIIQPQIEFPSIDSTTTYVMQTAGYGTVGASGNITYGNASAFFEDYTWSAGIDFYIDGPTGADQVFFRLTNAASGNARLEIGVDADNYPYVAYNAAPPTESPDWLRYTAGFRLPYDLWGLVNCDVNANTGVIELSYAEYNYQVDIYTGTTFFTEANSFTGVYGVLWYDDDVIFAVDGGAECVKQYNSGGAYQGSFGSFGAGNGEFLGPRKIARTPLGDLWVTDSGVDPNPPNDNIARVQKFNSSGVYQSKFGSYGTGDGQFKTPEGIAIDSQGNIFVTDATNNTVQKFSPTGTFIAKVSGLEKPVSVTIDRYDNIYVGEETVTSGAQCSIKVYTNDLEYSETLLFDDFQALKSVHMDVNGLLWVIDEYTEPQIRRVAIDGNQIEAYGTEGTGDGQFYSPADISTFKGNFVVADYGNNRIQIFTFSPLMNTDQNGSDETIDCSIDLSGLFKRFFFDAGADGSVDYLITPADGLPTLVDGTLQDYGTNQSYTEEFLPYEPIITGLEEITPPMAGGGGGGGFPGGYANVGENSQNLFLPLPYGNLIENSDSGVWVCPCIDSVAGVYCVAGWPIQSVTNGNVVSVYIDGVLQSSGYTFSESNDYQGKGNIATLTFSPVPDSKAVVTVRCNGKWVDGELLTNPIDVLEDWIDYAVLLVGGVSWQKDEATFSTARALCSSYGYTAAGVIQSANELGYWIRLILASFLGSFRFSSEGLLQVFIQELDTSSDVYEWFDENESINLKASSSLENVFNRIIVNYAIAYVQIDRRFKNGGEANYFRTADSTTGTDTQSIAKYGEQALTLSFDWTRNTATVEKIQEALLELYDEPEITIDYQGQDFKYMPLELNDQISATISLVRDSDNAIRENVLYKLRAKTHNLDDFTTTITMQSINIIDITTAGGVFVGGGRVYIDNQPIFIPGA